MSFVSFLPKDLVLLLSSYYLSSVKGVFYVPIPLHTLFLVCREWYTFYSQPANRISSLYLSLDEQTIEEELDAYPEVWKRDPRLQGMKTFKRASYQTQDRLFRLIEANSPGIYWLELLEAYLLRFPLESLDLFTTVKSAPYALVIKKSYTPQVEDLVSAGSECDLITRRTWLECLQMPLAQWQRILPKLLAQEGEMELVQFLHGSGIIQQLDCIKLFTDLVLRAWLGNRKTGLNITTLGYLYHQAGLKTALEWEQRLDRATLWEMRFYLAEDLCTYGYGVDGLHQRLANNLCTFNGEPYHPLSELGMAVAYQVAYQVEYLAEYQAEYQASKTVDRSYCSVVECVLNQGYPDYLIEDYVEEYTSRLAGRDIKKLLPYQTMRYTIVLDDDILVQCDSIEFIRGLVAMRRYLKEDCHITVYDRFSGTESIESVEGV